MKKKAGEWEPVDENQLYPVICSLYMGEMAGLITDKTFDILEILPKDESGEVLSDINTAIISRQ